MNNFKGEQEPIHNKIDNKDEVKVEETAEEKKQREEKEIAMLRERHSKMDYS